MRSVQFRPRERCDCSSAMSRGRRLLHGAMASGELDPKHLPSKTNGTMRRVLFRELRPFVSALCVFLILDSETRLRADSPTDCEEVLVVEHALPAVVSARDDREYDSIERGHPATRVLSRVGGASLVTFANEDLADGDDGTVQAGFELDDIAVAVLEIPSGYFPLEIHEVDVVWRSAGSSPQQVAVDLMFYENGVLVEVVEGAIMTGSGLMKVVVPSSYDRVFEQGPLSVGVKYEGTISGNVNPTLGHVVSAGTTTAECTPGANLVWNDRAQEWIDPCAAGMFGNFAIRATAQLLCPAPGGGPRVGDIVPDGAVNVGDWAALVDDLAGPAFEYGYGSFALRSDLTGDRRVDLRDVGVLQRHFGESVPCGSGPLRAGEGDAMANTDDLSPAPLEKSFPGIHAEVQRLPTRVAADARLRYTVLQIGIIVFLAIILAVIVGTCIRSGCRAVGKAEFASQGATMDDDEANRLRQALDCLLELGEDGDQDAEDAWFWWSELQAYNAEILGNPKINRTVSDDDLTYCAVKILNRVTFHHTYITGSRWGQYGKNGIVILLFAEWQHHDCPNCSEEDLQPGLMNFRVRHNLVNVAPEFGHGFGE